MQAAEQDYTDTFNPDRLDGGPALTDAERNLAFAFDPAHDYHADVDRIQPPWTPPTATYGAVINGVPMAAAFSDDSGPREVRVTERDPKTRRTTRRAIALPHKRYVRAVDPGGNICPLIVSTCRPDADPEVPGKRYGDDGIGTFLRVIGIKQRRGWLIVERSDELAHPQSPYTGQQYIAWCLAVAEYRKKIRKTWLRAEQDVWVEERRQQARELAQVQGEALGGAIRDAIRESMPKGRAPKEP